MQACLLLASMFLGQPQEPPRAIALLDDVDARFFQQLNNDGGLDGSTVGFEYRDVFSGSVAVRASPMQRFSSRIPGWNHVIAENPGPGQYRYLRFAWKRIGGEGIMIQFHSLGSWNQRYVAGKPSPMVMNWGAMNIFAKEPPTEWTLTTRDLFKDFGPMTISGMALTPMEGGAAGLFDHFYLGRTVEDLDEATRRQFAPDPATIGWKADKMDLACNDLGHADSETAGAAMRMLLAGREATVPFFKKKLEHKSAPRDETQRIHALLADLEAASFRKRESASAELLRIGPPVIPFLRAGIANANAAETRRRLETLLRKFPEEAQPSVPPETLRKIRAMRVLERLGTEGARTQLSVHANQTEDAELALAAKESLVRTSKK